MVDATVLTTSGTVRGHVEDTVLVFRDVPYATSARFGPPETVAEWAGERAVADTPIAPQLTSRLAPVMGNAPEGHRQSEDCQRLTITTPAADGQRRPVLVWIHGGAWVTGAGSLGIYGGHRIANEGNVVVVALNYRLGVLGYLRAEGISEGNHGLADQLAALRWVHDNIAAFGGDPQAVTVAGQSAGAHAVQCLIGMPLARGLFRRAILQSSPAGLGLGNTRSARKGAKRFRNALVGSATTAPTSAILDAQFIAMRAAAGRLGLGLSTGIAPVPGVGVLPNLPEWKTEVAGRAPDLDVIIGTTAREAAAFYVPNAAIERLRRIPVLGAIAANVIERAVSTLVFIRPSRRLAAQLSHAGARIWVYQFDYAAPDSPFGACHCAELPFLLGADRDWAEAPMLRGTPPMVVASLGSRMRTAWLDFVRTGAPDPAIGWAKYTPKTPNVYRWTA
ncbi:putative carboxylesterase [Gordonia effusa NBRC 100432]|uniref:Carboxylic ester hydrolase n=1 Tax=Gordonia effusa NBRC 100432 TaxID=1077974 RepID=H0QXJ5_9ACTN|nr:carboxylesterase family protein [Gordonia effusa]GAB17546.1 putative carboxylesterase [Gordonia effusa NBRC 100432]